MRKPILIALRSLCASELLAALVFAPTQTGTKSLLLWAVISLAIEAANSLRIKKTRPPRRSRVTTTAQKERA